MVIIVLTAAIAAGVGFGAGWFVRSPAQVAADTAPPERSLLTAEVVEGTIEDPLTLPGTVTLGNSLDFAPALPAGIDAVVTARPAAVGDVVTPGAVVVEVSDRPVIYLNGTVPLLRDLQLGDRGDDVSRLQGSLAAWGAPEPDGIFGPQTARALRAMYDAAGYTAPDNAIALRSELVFAPSESARITSINSPVGSAAASPLVTVTTTPPEVATTLTESIAQQLAVGVTVSLEGLGDAIAGTIVRIDPPVRDDAGLTTVTVIVAPAAELAPDTVDTVVGIVVDDSAQRVTGLVVPLTAVYSDASGATFVQVPNENGETSRVAVTVDESGAGRARITAGDGSLAAGDEVVVGIQ